MSSRTVSVVLTAQVSNFLSNMRAAEERTREVERAARTATQQFRAHQEALHSVGVGMLAVGGMAAAGMALAVKASAEFGAKMAQLQSLSHASAGTMRQMSDAAMSVGTAYGFTATQVADAEIELQKAGVGVAAQLGGALKGALSLAAAGQMDVAQATEITTVAMTQFGLSAKDVPHLADLLAAGADKALGSVGDLGDALKNGGLQAHNMGMTIDDTVGVLSMFANTGILGAEAGTQLRSMFLRLQSPTKAASDMLKAHNITLNDSAGHFVGLTKLGHEMQAGLGTLSDAERNHALAVIFGSHAIVGATAVYNASGAAAAKAGLSLSDWTRAVNEGGFANAQAAGKMNSLTGDVQKLSAAFQNDLIKAGNAADGPLRGLAQTATGVVTALGGIPPVGQTAIMVVGGMTAAVGLLGGGALLLIPKITAARAALSELGISGREAGAMVGKGSALMLGLAAAASGFAAMQEHGTASAQQVSLAGGQIREGWKGLDKLFAGNGFIDSGNGVKDALDKLGNGSAAALKNLDGWTFGVAHFADVYKANEAKFDAMGQQLGALAQQNYSSAASSFSLLTSKYHLGAQATKTLLDNMTPYRDELIKVAEHNKIAATDANLLDLALGRGTVGAKAIATAHREAAAAAARDATATQKLAGEATSATTNLSALEKAIEGFGSAQLSARGASRALEQAVADATKTVAKNGKAYGDTTQAGRDNGAALDGIASAATDAAAKTLHLTHSTSDAAKVLQHGRDEFVKVATAALGSSRAANALADKLGLIPKNVGTAIHLTGYEDALVKAQALREELGRLHNKSITISVDTKGNTSAAFSDARESRAAGGAIDGPGQKGVDSVPAVLAPGEHVLTAGDVDRLGGQGGAYRFRAALAAGDVQPFAAGGAVRPARRHGSDVTVSAHGRRPAAKGKAPKPKPFGGVYDQEQKAATALASQRHAQTALDTANRQLKRQQQAQTRAQKALDRARNAAANITGKGSAGAKRAAQAHVRRLAGAVKADAARVKATQKRVAADTKTRDDAKQRRSDALAAAAQLRQGREDFVSAERRTPNRITEDPLAYVDQARSLSRDLTLSPARRKSLDTAANKYEAELVRLTKSSADAAQKLTDLKAASDQLRTSTRSAIAGGYTLSGAAAQQTASGWMVRDGIRFQTTSTGPTAASIGAYYRQGAGDAAAFAAALRQLAGRGIPGELLAQLAGMGTEAGSPIAQALLAASPSELADIGANFTAIGSAADDAGTTVADANYAQLIKAADDASATITAQIASDGEALRKLIARAFGLSGYAVGTDSATPGIHLVGEHGPELVGFRGGEKVLRAPDSARWIRGAAAGGGSGQVISLRVAMPQSLDLVDSGGGLISTVEVVARGVAVQEIAADALHDAVLMSGGAA